jgi:hypothetical protein
MRFGPHKSTGNETPGAFLLPLQAFSHTTPFHTPKTNYRQGQTKENRFQSHPHSLLLWT